LPSSDPPLKLIDNEPLTSSSWAVIVRISPVIFSFILIEYGSADENNHVGTSSLSAIVTVYVSSAYELELPESTHLILTSYELLLLPRGLSKLS